MALYKNKASQKLAVYAHDKAADAPKTGDAANITARISLNGGSTAATNDTNPTELDSTNAPGVYIFDLTAAETNADLVIVFAKSATADVVIEPVIVYTEPEIRSADVLRLGSSSPPLSALVDALTGAGAIRANWVELNGEPGPVENAQYILDGTGGTLYGNLTESVGDALNVSGLSLSVLNDIGMAALTTIGPYIDENVLLASYGEVIQAIRAKTDLINAAGGTNPGSVVAINEDLTAGTSCDWEQTFYAEGLSTADADGYIFTVKRDQDEDDDADALLTVIARDDEPSGLLVLNRAEAADNSLASLTVTEDDPNTTIALHVKAAAMQLPPSPSAGYYWELDCFIDGKKVRIGKGRVVIERTVRRSSSPPATD